MKKFLFLGILALPFLAVSQDMDRYFETIRSSKAKLTAFFTQMPKGGDLHHHFSGSVYAETYLKYIVDKDLYINKRTYDVKALKADSEYVQISKLENPSFAFYRQKLIEKWSVKDYNGVNVPSDKLFFGSFPLFDIASKNTFDEGLLELKERAKAENVSYIETMFTGVKCDMSPALFDKYNEGLRTLEANRDDKNIQAALEEIYQVVKNNHVTDSALKFNKVLEERHHRLGIDDSSFTLRYQNYVLRLINNPARVFKDLIAAFESADTSSLIVGVNIVGAEDDEVSMKDYWLHIQMFSFCHRKYKKVKYAMHAGELTLGMVKPEELSWHINAAVFNAGANRIGHGADLAYEKQSPALLAYMKAKKIPVEINLYSNEFILKVKNDDHPVILYRNAGVPIVIASDDAGVLRSNLTHQYVLLANRYPEFSYSEIKKIVFNSILYSFIEESSVRNTITRDLDLRFKNFENSILKKKN